MAIEKNQMKYEIEQFLSIQQWIEKQIEFGENEYDEIMKKVSTLKKSSRGTYSEELELVLKMQEIAQNRLKNYSEGKQKPYFARIDFKEKAIATESFYIGKHGLNDDRTMEEKVIDWRAPIADLYYSGTQGDVSYEAPIGEIEGELLLKRKFLVKNEQLEDAFDEGVNEIILKSGVENQNENALIDEFLRINLEESRSSKLKDVVATIQKEQNDIIRADMSKPIIIQGSAGSGKTTIALHRLAYLIYRHKKFLTSDDILVVAPNKLFLDYISDVLPDLGVDMVKQVTYLDICKKILKYKVKIFSKDKKLSDILEQNIQSKDLRLVSSKFKGSKFFKIIIDRYLKYIEHADAQVSDIKYDDYILFSAREIKRLFLKDLAHIPMNKRKKEIKRYLIGKIKNKLPSINMNIDNEYDRKIFEIKSAREDSQERRKLLILLYDERDAKKDNIKLNVTKAIDKYFDNWILKDIKSIYLELFNNKEIFDKVTDGKIPNSLYEHLVDGVNNNDFIDSDDLTPMTYLGLMIEGIPENLQYKHIVIDEAQDYSVFEMEVIKLLSKNSSMTIVGDLGQGIYTYKSLDSWNDIVNNIFDGECKYIQLSQSYRSTVEIIDFANNVLSKQCSYIKPAIPVLRHGKQPQIVEYDNYDSFVEYLEDIIKEVDSLGKDNIAIIGRTYEECKEIHKILKKKSSVSWNLVKDNDKAIDMKKIIIPSYLTKGLEFDCSVVLNCDDVNYRDNELDKKLLYVILTRALHLEYVFFKGKKSPLI